MSNKSLLIPKKDAKDKVKVQLTKGNELVEEAQKLLKSEERHSRDAHDTFDEKYIIWRRITSDTLLEIFSNAYYSDKFSNKSSSVYIERSSRKSPDIYYTTEKYLSPQIEFLKLLLSTIDDCEYKKPEKPKAIKITTPIKKIGSDKTETNNVGRTFWDFVEEHKLANIIFFGLLVLIIAALLIINKLKFGWANGGPFFELG